MNLKRERLKMSSFNHLFLVFIFIFFLQTPFVLSARPPLIITFDNLPLQDSACLTGEEKRERCLKTLEDEKLETVFFIVGEELVKNPKSSSCLKRVLEQGHRIANHSYTHPHLTDTSLEDYITDVYKCNEFIKHFSLYRPWFRYPFLDIGLDPLPRLGASGEKAIACAEKFKAQGFRHGYVTIDSFDWFLNVLLLEAIEQGKTIKQEDLEAFYVAHLRKMIVKYLTLHEKESFSAHVLLLHSNADITMLCLPRMIHMLKEDGWIFTSPEEAFNHPANTLADFNSVVEQAKWALRALTPSSSPSSEPKKGSSLSSEATEAFRQMVLHE